MLKRPFAKRRVKVKSSLEPMEPRIAPANITVMNLNESGAGSLRAAIDQANINPGADTIDFAAGLSGTIALESALQITESVSITGPGAGVINISGNDSTQIFRDTTPGADLSLTGLTLTHGAGGDGGAIYVDGGGLSLHSVALINNLVTNRGGAIYVNNDSTTLDIQDSVITTNHAGNRGGGLYLQNISAPSFTISNTVISGNDSGDHGGGVFLYQISSPDASIKDSTITGNSAPHFGGGVLMAYISSPLAIQRTTISGNSAQDGAGALLYLCTGDLRIEDSTISGNTATISGTGIELYGNSGTFTLRNSTISGNMGEGASVHIYNGNSEDPGGTVTIQNSTITANTSNSGVAGIFVSSYDQPVLIQSTIVAGNIGGTAGSLLPTSAPDLQGSFTVDHSLIKDPGTTGVTNGTNGNITGVDPMLGALANNGGPTQTHALLTGSPAIDAGSNPAGLMFDQRGMPFARSAFAAPDMGAFEVQGVDLALTKSAPNQNYAPGDTIDFSLGVANHSGATATGVTITDVLPADLTFNAGENVGWTNNGGTLTYDYGTLAGQATDTVHLLLHVKNTVGIDTETITNSASIADDGMHGTDTNPLDNDATATVGITADATLHISVDDNITKTVAHGGKITYTLTYSNTGDQDADVTLVEHLGTASSFTSIGSTPGWTFNSGLNQWEFHVPTLAAGDGPHTVTFVAQTSNFIPTSVSKITDSVEIQYTSGEAIGNESSDTTDSVDTLVYQGIEVFTPGVSAAGHYSSANVRVIDIALHNAELPAETDFLAYPAKLKDSFRTAVADFNGDGFDDIIIIPEHGGAGVRIFDGTTGELLESPLNGLRPFGPGKGAFVAVPKFHGSVGLVADGLPIGDEVAAVVFGSSLGGGAIKVYDPIEGGFEGGGHPFGVAFKGGVRVATADVNGNGVDDLIVAQGNFGNLVKVYHEGALDEPLGSFRVGAPGYKGGVNLATGDVDHDGMAEIVASHNRLGAPVVEVWDFHFSEDISVGGGDGTFVKIASFNAFAANYHNGVRVAVADVNLDGNLDLITAVGYAGKSQVKIFDGTSIFERPTLATGSTGSPEVLSMFTAFPSNPLAGIWVSATSPVPSVNSFTPV